MRIPCQIYTVAWGGGGGGVWPDGLAGEGVSPVYACVHLQAYIGAATQREGTEIIKLYRNTCCQQLLGKSTSSQEGG